MLAAGEIVTSAQRGSIWPDWTGDTVAIVASGPSLKNEKLEHLCGRVKVIAIKQSFERCKFADAVYGCDAAWWIHRNGLPEFKGLKFAWGDKAWGRFPDLIKVTIKNPNLDRMVFDEIGAVGAGGNSAFQALNLSVQFGAARVLMIGLDLNDRNGLHWYGRNSWAKANNPEQINFDRWRVAFTGAAQQLSERGIEVINTSPVSDLQCFPRRSIEQTLASWGL